MYDNEDLVYIAFAVFLVCESNKSVRYSSQSDVFESVWRCLTSDLLTHVFDINIRIAGQDTTIAGIAAF